MICIEFGSCYVGVWVVVFVKVEVVVYVCYVVEIDDVDY